jgi:hypothetical protein
VRGRLSDRSQGRRRRAFDEVARRAVNHAGEAFAAFPRADGRGGYESVLIVPIAT